MFFVLFLDCWQYKRIGCRHCNGVLRYVTVSSDTLPGGPPSQSPALKQYYTRVTVSSKLTSFKLARSELSSDTTFRLSTGSTPTLSLLRPNPIQWIPAFTKQRAHQLALRQPFTAQGTRRTVQSTFMGTDFLGADPRVSSGISSLRVPSQVLPAKQLSNTYDLLALQL